MKRGSCNYFPFEKEIEGRKKKSESGMMQ